MAREYENLVVGRTLSKAFALAGLRLGYAAMPLWAAEQYRQIASLFSISSPSLAAGAAALSDLEYMSIVSKIISERERLQSEIEGACPSEGNFLFIHTKEKSDLVSKRLLKRGIIVRVCSIYPGAGDCCLRVTVSTPEQNDLIIEAFREADR